MSAAWAIQSETLFQVAVALGAGIWRYKKCLNQYWLYRYFTAQAFLVVFSTLLPWKGS